jgi:hypothetical protein
LRGDFFDEIPPLSGLLSHVEPHYEGVATRGRLNAWNG